MVGGQAKIFLTHAEAADLTHWSTPAVVAPVPTDDRVAAELSASASGRLDLAFYDRSCSGNLLTDMTCALSADGGATWTSQRVTKSGFDPSRSGVPCSSCANGVRPFLGDYNGIVSLGDGAGMTWTGPGRTYRDHPTNLEIYFARRTP